MAFPMDCRALSCRSSFSDDNAPARDQGLIRTLHAFDEIAATTLATRKSPYEER